MTYNDYPLVSVVIPTHNRKDKLIRLIDSLLKSNYPRNKLEIIVVDDASTDGTCDTIRQLYPEVKLRCNDEEKYVAESRNIGIKISRGKYIFLIDDDNIVDPNTIKELVEFMEKNPYVGVAAPLMYFLKDPRRIWCAGVKRNYWLTITKYIGYGKIDDGTITSPYESEDFPNAFMVRKEVIDKVGLFNSKLFPIHYEESDFCQRIRKAGYKVMLVPTAKVWHDVPLPSTRFNNRDNNNKYMNMTRIYYTVRNRIIFHRLYSKNILQKIISVLSAISIILLHYTPRMLRHNRNKFKTFSTILKGIIDGLLMKL